MRSNCAFGFSASFSVSFGFSFLLFGFIFGCWGEVSTYAANAANLVLGLSTSQTNVEHSFTHAAAL